MAFFWIFFGIYALCLSIFSHRPDLFDYEELVAVNDVEYTLYHAFHIAESNFRIAKLLEPKGI